MSWNNIIPVELLDFKERTEDMATDYWIDTMYLTYVSVNYGWGTTSLQSSVDHPAFDALRQQLGNLGFIKVERGYANGDRVTKEFSLNGYDFAIGDQFSSAGAMGIHLKCSR